MMCGSTERDMAYLKGMGLATMKGGVASRRGVIQREEMWPAVEGTLDMAWLI